MSNVFYRHTLTDYPVAVKGDGCYLIDKDNKKYLNGSSGAAVSCLGHSDKDVVNAMKNQLDKVPFAHSGFLTTEPAEQLADELIKLAPEGISKVYFVSGGSEAVESAIKLVIQYFTEIGKKEKHIIIGREQSYHGNTLGALSAGGNAARKELYKKILVPSMQHISPCYEYRGKKEDETSEQYGLRVANELETKILELGAENVAAFIAEPVVGATLGCVSAVKGYFKRIREICDKYEVLLILDEVMCGMGRTGYLFACEVEGITGDIITIAKGLGAGYMPIGATLVSDKIFKAIQQGRGYFQHGHTYMGHATACACGLEVIKKIQALLPNVKNMGDLLQQKFRERIGDHTNVGDIRGRGLFVGVELVKNKKTKETLNPSLKINAKIKAKAMKNGLMCYAMGGTVDGVNGDHIMFAPPFIVNEEHIQELVDKFEKTLNEVL